MPSTAEEVMTLTFSETSNCLGSFKYGFVSLRDFFFMINYTTGKGHDFEKLIQ